MSWYDRDDSRRQEDRYRESVRSLERSGFRRNEYGHFDDPDRPERTGCHIDRDGTIHRDM